MWTRINSCCIAAGHMLIIILVLLVGLLILLVSLLSCSIFGCSLCLVLVSFWIARSWVERLEANYFQISTFPNSSS
jgi:hypothetical protein